MQALTGGCSPFLDCQLPEGSIMPQSLLYLAQGLEHRIDSEKLTLYSIPPPHNGSRQLPNTGSAAGSLPQSFYTPGKQKLSQVQAVPKFQGQW